MRSKERGVGPVRLRHVPGRFSPVSKGFASNFRIRRPAFHVHRAKYIHDSSNLHLYLTTARRSLLRN